MAGLGMYEAVTMGPRTGNSWANVGVNQTFTMAQQTQNQGRVEVRDPSFPSLDECTKREILVESKVEVEDDCPDGYQRLIKTHRSRIRNDDDADHDDDEVKIAYKLAMGASVWLVQLGQGDRRRKLSSPKKMPNASIQRGSFLFVVWQALGSSRCSGSGALAFITWRAGEDPENLAHVFPKFFDFFHWPFLRA